MPQTPIYYRLTVYAEDGTTPLIVLSSHPDAANALLCEAPEGDGQTIDPIKGTIEVGSYTWQAADRYDGDDVYTITSAIADGDARNQLLSHKCVGEWSTDGTTWDVLHTGFLNDLKLGDAATYTFIVGDSDRRERDAVLFKTLTTQFDKVSNFIGGPVESTAGVAYQGSPTRAWGPLIDYGPARFVVIANPSGLVDSSNRITLSLVGGNLPPRYLGFQGVWNGKIPNPAEYINQLASSYFEEDAAGIYATTGAQQSQPWGSFPGLEVKLRRVSDSTVFRSFPIAQAVKKASAGVFGWPGGIPDFPLGDPAVLVANSNDWLIVAWDSATMGSPPSVGTTFDGWVRPLVISEKNPLHLAGHPIDLHRLANTQEGIPDDATSAAATKAALGDLWYELRITGEMPYADFTEMLKSSAGYAVVYNANGVQEFLPTRMAQPDAVATVTTADIIGNERGEPTEVIFRVGENSAIKGVDYKLQRFRLWNENLDSGSDRPADGIVADELTIKGRRRDDSVKGSKIVTFDVPGMIMMSGGALVLNQPLRLRAWIEASGDVIIDRAGWGWPEGELEVLATVPGRVGEYLDLEAPHQVNAKVGQDPITQRGGTRKVQIVSRTEMPGTAKLKVKDAGNLAQDPPEAPDNGGVSLDPCDGIPTPELVLTESTDNPTTIATVTLSNVADFDDLNADVELQYLVQEAMPDPTDEGAFFGPLESSTGADTIDAPAVASGETIWVRGRALVVATQNRCEWSDWTSITLGPDDDGTGGTIPPFTLALQIDGDGVLSATANSVDAAITTIYFLAGAAGGAAPLYADVLASSFVDSSGPPFTAADLATMAEGETRTVGAIGEDALGNRTVLVTASITRAVNTGSGSGTPGNLSLTLIAGTPAVCRNVDTALREYKSLKRARKYWNTANVLKARLQPNVWDAASEGSELHWVYSLNGGATFAESGVFVRADRVNFPEPGPYLELAAAAKGPNILFSLATKNGDGTMTLAVSDVYIDTVSSEPPDSPSGDPSDLPNGGGLGNLIHRMRAVSLVGVVVDGGDVTLWEDETTPAEDAEPNGLYGQTPPTFHETGFPGGYPCVRFREADDSGLIHVNPDTGDFTRYFVVADIQAGVEAFDCFIDGINGGPASFNITVLSDGTLGAAVNSRSGDNTGDSTASAYDDGNAHILCFVFDLAGVHWYLFVDDMSTPAADHICAGEATVDGPNVRYGRRPPAGGVFHPKSANFDMTDEAHYDRAHDETARNTVANALADLYGITLP